jgi:hypothetical protein
MKRLLISFDHFCEHVVHRFTLHSEGPPE